MTPSEKRALLARPGVRAAVEELGEEFQRGRLTLYLGAGVSRDSGLPSWNTLIASLYYNAVDEDWKPAWEAFPNYLYALGEWFLTKSGQPPEVIAGKIESYYGSNPEFAEQLKETLYLPWRQMYGSKGAPQPAKLRRGNALLDAVAKVCEATTGTHGIQAVVTTNYDSLLEHALSNGPSRNRFKPIWKSSATLPPRAKGIFHVHGYLPESGDGSPYDEILLTEAQYYEAASNAYSWSNLTFLQCFSSSTGLMIGMSMTDRNVRRLLHAMKATGRRPTQYLIVIEEKLPQMTAPDYEEVNDRAIKYAQRFANSGLKQGGKLHGDIQAILWEIFRQEKTMTEKMLEAMGVKPLWVEDYSEIPAIVEAVAKV